jgi:DNA modification methylase
MRLADLKLNPDNPRNIKPDKLEKLAQSIKDFPKMMLKRPIVYDENKIIIGGNMRYKAIEKLGMTEIPDEWTSDASDFTPEERKRFIMQDNAEMGEHDWDMVANQYELEDLEAWGIDVPYADVAEEVEEDEAPEVSSEPPVSQLGSIYQLGRHRVMCGDSTDKASVELLMDNAKADMVFTDPPYNVDYEGGSGLKIENDNFGTDEEAGEKLWLPAFTNMREVAEEHCSIYMTMPQGGTHMMMMMMMQKSGWQVKHELIWKKNSLVLSRADYNYQHEPILYGWNEKHVFYGKGKFKNTSVWDIDRPTKSKEHPTMKPIELVAECLLNSTKVDDVVIDLFLGSGSTLIACEQTDRTCYGMELDPKYTDVIRRRYWKFVNNGDETGWEENTPAVDVK